VLAVRGVRERAPRIEILVIVAPVFHGAGTLTRLSSQQASSKQADRQSGAATDGESTRRHVRGEVVGDGEW
jgi:hypothetical protein